MSSTTTQSVDVVIVGAGLSGLRAATELHKYGLSYVVLEAMDRVGGKTLTVPASSQGGVVDVGAAWINDTNQAEMYRLGKKFGFEFVEQWVTGLNLFQNGTKETVSYPYGSMTFPLSSEQQAQVQKAFVKLANIVERSYLDEPWSGPDAVRLDSLNCQELIEKEVGGELANMLVNMLSRSLLGVESHEMSALFLINYIKSGTGIENISSDQENGNQTFSIRLAEGLIPGSVKLSSPVKIISQSDSRCTVETESGQIFKCKKVILSVPSTLYPSISFLPDLPHTKKVLSESRLGYYSKTVLVYKEPWWRNAGLSGSTMTADGPIVFSRDTCVPEDGQYSITCFHVGEPGRRWSKLSTKEERQKEVLGQFNAMFSTVVDNLPDPINIIEKEWTKDEWTMGAPSPVMARGVMTNDAGKAIREPFGNVHFIGTETSLIWKGYMEGAVLSGIRGAEEVIAVLV
ncbi:amine oxidase [flavin-containing] A [Colletotrichum spaethianum]|uniref:Amine oxidase n=1 Tax=Colletotrichum spaethianum TaxID=700344 RepID=A0AA37P798_9PEZI|nr:amine oxidase [flavin-containing] A [Colletotrichum spaethianum]GKT42784.1 amine oxidase [flavin-containing] A [Colletotrichum spaethianum]